MPVTIKRAVKYNAKLRLALAGPSGSGKTYTALTLAMALADEKGVILIDTERGSASKYADIFPAFDVIDLESFSPLAYIEAIKAAEKQGCGVLIIDSLSHAWNGPGGVLEIVENATRHSTSKSSFNAWGEATPLQNKLVDTITRSPLHIICTMRSKTEYVVEIINNKSVPRKVGMAPVQRADVEYEFDVYADMDIDNTLFIHKSRCPQLAGATISKPDAQVAEVLKTWLQGAARPPQDPPVATSPHNGNAPSVEPHTQNEQSDGLKSLIAQAKARAKAVGVASNIKEWYAFVAEVLGSEVQELSLADVGKINGSLTQLEKFQARDRKRSSHER